MPERVNAFFFLYRWTVGKMSEAVKIIHVFRGIKQKSMIIVATGKNAIPRPTLRKNCLYALHFSSMNRFNAKLNERVVPKNAKVVRSMDDYPVNSLSVHEFVECP